MLIDTALLSSLSANNTNLIFTFSHLALGGMYISGTNHTHIIAVITMGDVEVEIDGDIEGPIQVRGSIFRNIYALIISLSLQVTVYNDTGLFNTSGCGKDEGIQGDNDLAPVISVSDETTDGGSETITITYHIVRTTHTLRRQIE